MDETGFMSLEDSAELRRLSNLALNANGELMAFMLSNLPADRRDLLGAVLEEGGRVGIEAAVDQNGARTLSLVGVDRDGRRHKGATILFVGDPPRQR